MFPEILLVCLPRVRTECFSVTYPVSYEQREERTESCSRKCKVWGFQPRGQTGIQVYKMCIFLAVSFCWTYLRLAFSLRKWFKEKVSYMFIKGAGTKACFIQDSIRWFLDAVTWFHQISQNTSVTYYVRIRYNSYTNIYTLLCVHSVVYHDSHLRFIKYILIVIFKNCLSERQRDPAHTRIHTSKSFICWFTPQVTQLPRPG